MDVLVVGAGPTGLALAAGLAGQGVRCRVVDSAPRPPAGTRCPNLWPRTQQVLDAFGVDMVALRRRSTPFTTKVWQPFDDPITVDIREDSGPWAIPRTAPQDVVATLLTQRLRECGGHVDWGTRLTAVHQDAHGVTVTLEHTGGTTEQLRTPWLVAADGADSTVRGLLGIGWEANAFPEVGWVQCDVAVDCAETLDPHTEYIFHAPQIHLGIVPLPGGTHRLFLSVPRGTDSTDLTDPAAISALLRGIAGADISVTALDAPWVVTPQAGLAATFRHRRCLLAGEAARTFPLPVQAMNTGIQDAANLAWKLAAVIRDGTDARLLDSYGGERRAVAEALIARTTWLLTSSLDPDAIAMFRAGYAQRGGRPLVRTEPDVEYPRSSWVEQVGPAAAAAGVPLPETPVRMNSRRTAPLTRLIAGPMWTLLVGADGPLEPELDKQLRLVAERHPVVVRVIHDGSAPARTVDLRDDSGQLRRLHAGRLCLVRPDGYVGFNGPLDDVPALDAYLSRVLA